MSSAALAPGHIIAGRYRIECLLGQGAMGSVYRALQLSIERPVALKVLAFENGERHGLIERFGREARALSRLSHPNTVRLFDYGSDEHGAPFIVMELLRGSNLAEDLERQGPLRWDQALHLLQAVAGSLAEAHQAGIVHRDIKPANVFLCAGAAWPTIKVLDFGIAGETDPEGASRLTRTGTVVGSAAYMSPEQAQGQTVGAASDLYALGVLSFEAMTARTPFDSRAFTAQLLAKVLEPAPALREVCPTLDVPVEVEDLVRELLDRDPARRPDSAALIARCDALLARFRLAPLEREVLAARSLSAPPEVAKTEPMRVAQTLGDGWSPPRTGTAPRVSVDATQRRPLGQLLALAALAGGFSAGLAWALGSQVRAPADEVGSTAPPAPTPEGSIPPDEDGRGMSIVENPPFAPPSKRSLAPAASPGPPAGIATPKPSRPRATPSTPPSALPAERAQPPTRVPEAPRYPNVAAVEEAKKAGEVTSVEHNRLIRALHAQEEKALARVREAAKHGKISQQELDDEEAAIKLEFEGP